jgi:anti-sigma regulatory factor (Ser/Thr protein kinase)
MPKTQAPAKLENLVILQKFITDFAGTQGFSDKRILEIELACEEAVVNIINYAYSNENMGNIEINCSVDQKGDCTIELIDTGPPFDLRAIADPNINENITERRIGGIGTLLIKKFADEIKYHRLQNKNFLSLKFSKQN